jgi:hypothetical protein
MVEIGDKVLLLPTNGKLIAIKLDPVKVGDKIALIPTKGGKPIAVKLSPVKKGDKIISLTTSGGKRIALKYRESANYKTENSVEISDDVKIEFKENGV